ncbi:heme oxygenase-like protein [Xylariaceae sp. FL0255]|nr:heme oxygenase-like protein [Xylariaceae sp. FL0255]
MPSKTTEPPVRPLSESINIATRSVHAKLNKLIISRLPLSLPPVATDASQYVSGLLHIAPIYIAFESLWREILDSPDPLELNAPEADSFCNTCDAEDAPDTPPVLCSRKRALLTHLHFDDLQRSKTLQDDLQSLTGWSSCTLGEQLNQASFSPVLSHFLSHIRTSIESSPHVLLAYAWVLYMALFSGGRFIRAQLETVFPDFWVPASAHQQQQMLGSLANPDPPNNSNFAASSSAPLRFFRFDTPEDGEDIKREFKKRLAECEALLTDGERDEIVQEARCIFDFMVRLTGELDEICGTDLEAAESRLLGLRSRDSVVVERERLAKRRSSSSDEPNLSPGSKNTGEGHVKFPS